jgi:hypothetical protein
MRTRLGFVAVFVLGLSACGSSDGVAATATKGDAFCKLAQVAKDDNDAFEAVDASDSAKVKLELGAALDSLDAAVAKAPKDIADTAKTLLSKEEQLEKLLKANDYDFSKVLQTDEGKKLSEDKEAKQAGDDFKAYLNDKCDIASSDSTPSDSTPSDSTPIDLGEGEDAINKFLDYYELGTGADLTDDERSCIVSQLVDKVTGDDLNQAMNSEPSPELQQALGLAFINCNVTVQS